MPAHRQRPCLLDLPDDALLAIGSHLGPALQDRLALTATCRRLRTLGAGPSPLWRTVSFSTNKKHLARAGRENRMLFAEALAGTFACWLAPRLAAVESLSFTVLSPEPLVLPAGHPPVRLPALLLVPPGGAFGGGGVALPALRQLSIQWPGAAVLCFASAPPLPALRRLSLPDGTDLSVPAATLLGPLPAQLAQFELCDGSLSVERGPWLPPSLSALCLAGARLRCLPDVLTHLPQLRSLQLSTNRLGSAPLDALGRLAATLQELHLSETYLTSFPTQLSSLTALRVLYLHNAFHRSARLAPGDGDALRPLCRLAFLSISANQLAALPPAVADMTQLQGLHIEDNELAGGLPHAPCLAGLRELLMDWQAALDSAASLRAAIALTRLILSGHRAVDLVGEQRLAIRPAAAAEPLLATLAALPALRRVEDVFVGGEDVVTAPVAAVMWQLGGRCRHLRVGLLQDANVGMTLADLEKAEAAAGTAGAVGEAAVACTAGPAAAAAAAAAEAAPAGRKGSAVSLSGRSFALPAQM
ncbi:hypothetical protein ABPG75_003374 [Micractinium tetrahymenae]